MSDQSSETPGSGKSTIARCSVTEAQRELAQLHEGWSIDEATGCITRRFEVKGFSKAVYLANLAVFLADRDHHHPDVAFGWGYCQVSFSTHDAGGLSILDFKCAARLDAMVAPTQ